MFDLSQFNEYREDNRREERAGSGVPDIYSVWENQGWIAPQVIEEYAPDRTILKLSFIKRGMNKKTIIKSNDKKSAKTEERLQQILQYMKDGTAYHSDEIAESIGLKSSRTRELLNMLVKENRLESIGENRNRRYQIKIDVR